MNPLQIGNVSLFSKSIIDEYFLLYPLSNEEIAIDSIIGDNDKIQEVQGNLTVENNIFKTQLYVSENVVCNGIIEQSTIVCLGDVFSEGTLNQCSIYARGEIRCASLSNTFVENGKNVIVRNEIRNCDINTGGSIEGVTAVVQGSKVVACDNILVDRAIKPTDYIQTSLIAGDKRILREKIVQQKAKLSDIEIKIESAKKAIEKIVFRMVQVSKVSVKIPILDEVKKTLKELRAQLEPQKNIIQSLIVQSQTLETEKYIQINTSFTDGIFIEIDGTKFHTIASNFGVRFKTDGQNVFSLPIKQLL
jgi:hypothetical protein